MVVVVAVDGVIGQVAEEGKAGGRRRRERRNGRRRPKRRREKSWKRTRLPHLGIGRVRGVWRGGRRLMASAVVAVAVVAGVVSVAGAGAGVVVLLVAI